MMLSKTVALLFATLALGACTNNPPVEAAAQDTPAQALTPAHATLPDPGVLATTKTMKVTYMPGGAEKTIDDPREVARIVAALGEGPVTDAIPRCMPQARISFLTADKQVGEASFCDATLTSKVVRLDVGNAHGALTVKDATVLQAVLAAAPSKQ